MRTRTPLSHVRGLGTARSGTDHFIRQRVTAIASIPLTIFLIFLIASLVGMPHDKVTATFESPLIAIFTAIALVSITAHMRLGMQVIIEDYIHGKSCRLLALMANSLFCAFITIAGVFAILKMSLGG